MSALFRPLIRASTYRRAVFLLLGSVILLPYVLLVFLLGRILVMETANRVAVLLIVVVSGVIVLVPPFLGGTRELEIAAARALLRAELPERSSSGPLALETRLRAALWFGVHLAVGAVVGVALLMAVPMVLIIFTERAGLTSGALGDLPGGLWAWTVAGVLLLLGTVYAIAGLGSLAATMAPVLLGPSPAERLAAVEERERRLAERNRLARELHDSVGHALTATTLQAGAARAVFDKDPEFARRALEAIEEVGRSAMEDLDHVLGVLRSGTDDRIEGHTLDRLDRLIQDAGVAVTAEISLRGMDATVSREAYRIVQEGLTNAAKYGDGTASLRLVSGTDLIIEVTNPISERQHTSGGRGLAGIAERVRLLGGSLQAGPDGQDWLLRARLPLGE